MKYELMINIKLHNILHFYFFSHVHQNEMKPLLLPSYSYDASMLTILFAYTFTTTMYKFLENTYSQQQERLIDTERESGKNSPRPLKTIF